MALAESTHHGAQRQKKTRAGGEARVALHGHVPEAPLPQGRVLRHVVGHLSVPALDVPVPQMVDQLPDIEQFFRALSPDLEQVIEVPKFLPLDVPKRAALCATQLVEQLVEVPTIISCSSLLRTVEQHVDIPVPVGGGRLAGLQGDSQVFKVFFPDRVQQRRPSCISLTFPVEVFKVLALDSVRQRLRLFPAGSDDDADEPCEGVFRTFPRPKKVRSWLRTRGRNCSPNRAHPRRLLSWRTPSSGCSSGNASRARPTTGTDVLTAQSGRHHLVSRSCGSAKGMRIR